MEYLRCERFVKDGDTAERRASLSSSLRRPVSARVIVRLQCSGVTRPRFRHRSSFCAPARGCGYMLPHSSHRFLGIGVHMGKVGAIDHQSRRSGRAFGRRAAFVSLRALSSGRIDLDGAVLATYIVRLVGRYGAALSFAGHLTRRGDDPAASGARSQHRSSNRVSNNALHCVCTHHCVSGAPTAATPGRALRSASHSR